MGNRMFQYAFGYILSKLKKCNIYASSIPNFNIPDTLCNYAELKADNAIRTSSYGNNYANLSELINTDCDIIVDSFLQKSAFYTPHVSLLRDCFNIKSTPLNNTDELILHVRETDYKDIGCFLGYENYRYVIKESKCNNIVIVTDNSNCETVQRLLADGCKLYTEGYVNTFSHSSDERSMKDFNLLLNSDSIAISQSSFSWWAAFLGEQKNVYFPFCKLNGLWKVSPGFDDIDLFVNHHKCIKIII